MLRSCIFCSSICRDSVEIDSHQAYYWIQSFSGLMMTLRLEKKPSISSNDSQKRKILTSKEFLCHSWKSLNRFSDSIRFSQWILMSSLVSIWLEQQAFNWLQQDLSLSSLLTKWLKWANMLSVSTKESRAWMPNLTAKKTSRSYSWSICTTISANSKLISQTHSNWFRIIFQKSQKLLFSPPVTLQEWSQDSLMALTVSIWNKRCLAWSFYSLSWANRPLLMTKIPLLRTFSQPQNTLILC